MENAKDTASETRFERQGVRDKLQEAKHTKRGTRQNVHEIRQNREAARSYASKVRNARRIRQHAKCTPQKGKYDSRQHPTSKNLSAKRQQIRGHVFVNATICVCRRTFSESERVAEHKRRRWTFAAPLKVERAARKLEERRRSCAHILEGPICCRNLRPQALVLRKRACCRTQTAAMELCGAAQG